MPYGVATETRPDDAVGGTVATSSVGEAEVTAPYDVPPITTWSSRGSPVKLRPSMRTSSPGATVRGDTPVTTGRRSGSTV